MSDENNIFGGVPAELAGALENIAEVPRIPPGNYHAVLSTIKAGEPSDKGWVTTRLTYKITGAAEGNILPQDYTLDPNAIATKGIPRLVVGSQEDIDLSSHKFVDQLKTIAQGVYDIPGNTELRDVPNLMISSGTTVIVKLDERTVGDAVYTEIKTITAIPNS